MCWLLQSVVVTPWCCCRCCHKPAATNGQQTPASRMPTCTLRHFTSEKNHPEIASRIKKRMEKQHKCAVHTLDRQEQSTRATDPGSTRDTEMSHGASSIRSTSDTSSIAALVPEYAADPARPSAMCDRAPLHERKTPTCYYMISACTPLNASVCECMCVRAHAA